MDYKKIYADLISRARLIGITKDYYETHHIVPRCMGGNDEPDNLVALSAREHYVAHLLLYKLNADVPGIVYSAYRMAAKNNREYALLRKKFIENQRVRRTKNIEYNGKIYVGFAQLKEETGITYHLYKKYYENGIDPLPYLGNNTYAMIAYSRNPTRIVECGKKWYNDGIAEKQSKVNIEGWKLGRLAMQHSKENGRWEKK